MAAIYRRLRHTELNSHSSTQGCNTLRLTYAHSHRASAATNYMVSPLDLVNHSLYSFHQITRLYFRMHASNESNTGLVFKKIWIEIFVAYI